jgi:hypothetical protein
VPSFKFGARQFQIQAVVTQTASTTGPNSTMGAFQYLPGMSGAGSYGTIDFAAEQIKQATLLFVASLAQANSTAAGGSMIVAASQFNSLGNSVASVNLYSQAVTSVAALTPLDVSTKLNTWSLSPGDSIYLILNTNTVGFPASLPNIILSGTIDAVTSS